MTKMLTCDDIVIIQSLITSKWSPNLLSVTIRDDLCQVYKDRLFVKLFLIFRVTGTALSSEELEEVGDWLRAVVNCHIGKAGALGHTQIQQTGQSGIRFRLPCRDNLSIPVWSLKNVGPILIESSDYSVRGDHEYQLEYAIGNPVVQVGRSLGFFQKWQTGRSMNALLRGFSALYRGRNPFVAD
jgi:hypothetical protein